MSFQETHPYNGECMPADTRILIVGTAPPPRFSNPRCKGTRPHKFDFDFFYGSGYNNMWLWLNQIAAEQGTALPNDEANAEVYGEAARNYLRKNRLWMKDVLQTYQRKPGHECGSSDDDIVKPRPSECTNFFEVLAKYLSIEALAFTSNKAAEWSFAAMGEPDHLRIFHDARDGRRNGDLAQPFHRMERGGRDVKFFLLPSPSGRAASNVQAINIYRSVFLLSGGVKVVF